MNDRRKFNKSKRDKTIKSCYLSLCFKINISDVEAIRIDNELKNSTLYHDIVFKYAPKSSFFKTVEKKSPVKGFRAGSKGSIDGICTRLAKSFSNITERNFSYLCTLYRQGVIEYFKEDRPNVFSLLDRELKIRDLQKATEWLVETAIIENIPLDDISTFAKLFGMSDNPIISSVLKKAESGSADILIDIVKNMSKKLADLASVQYKLESSSDAYRKRLKAIEVNFEKLNSNASLIGRIDAGDYKKSDNNSVELGLIKESLSSVIDDVNGIKENLNNTKSDIESNFQSHEAKLIEIEKDRQIRTSALKKQIDDLALKIKQQDTQIYKIESNISSISEVMNSLSKTPVKEKNLLPSPIRLLKPNRDATVIEKQEQFSSYYHLNLQRSDALHVDCVQAYIYHTLFLHSPLVLLDDFCLFESWVNTLGWSKNVVSYSAAPSWVSEENWELGARTYLDETDIPRFIIIHNFDIALVKSYLLPVLHQRLMRRRTTPDPATLIIIPSEPGIQIEYPEILQYGVGIETNDFLRLDNGERKFQSYIDDVKLGFNRTDSTFVTANNIKEWIKPNYERPNKLEEVFRASPVEIPSHQKMLAIHLSNLLQNALNEDEAILASTYHSIRLWSKAKYDEATSERFYELVAMITSGNVKY